MNNQSAPYFLDFEASGLGAQGFPIEVAWGNAHANMQCWLIYPDAAWSVATGWESSAQRIHGISWEQLLESGKVARWIAERMNEALDGEIVYVDGLPYDQLWLEQLFESAAATPSFQLGDFDELLYATIPRTMTYRVGWREQLRATAVARLKGLQWHRADNDVRRLMEMFRIAMQRR